MTQTLDIIKELQQQFGPAILAVTPARDAVATLWLRRERLHDVVQFLKAYCALPYVMLYDLTAIDERDRQRRNGEPASDFTMVYHLISFERNSDVRLKVPLQGEYPSVRSIADLFPNANWYEREVWDMFGIHVDGHPDLRRILLPPWWQGHALRKEHPSRGTEMGHFAMPADKHALMEEQLQFRPEDYGLRRESGNDEEFMFLNLGPHHPGTHGPLRLVLQLRDEQIINVVPDIGFHHRGQEKIAERQSWHTYIPYTDRVDYLGGVTNNIAYLMAVEQLAGIDLPPRAKYIRVMMCEFFRIASHLVWFGTFALDVGQFSGVFYIFTDRERILEFVEAVTGARMHPNWFRIGGVAQDLPAGWQTQVRKFIDYFPPRLDQYQKMIMDNAIFQGRTKGVGKVTTLQALDWGMTGPNLRATGMAWDWRKKRPYSGYEEFAFDVPTATEGDCYARATVRMAEMRQSLRIIEQCLANMPEGDYKSRHPLTTPPLKPQTMQDIETLITHFVGVSWGPVIPPGEAISMTEGTKGSYSYYCVSDGNTWSYRTHIRTASFPHIQMVPMMARGLMVADLIAILGSIDFVLADVDR